MWNLDQQGSKKFDKKRHRSYAKEICHIRDPHLGEMAVVGVSDGIIRKSDDGFS